MQELAQLPLSIVSIEDPIEYSLPGVAQMQTNAQTGFTFANGLRSILRQDPDVLMVGEIRDAETARMAVNAALTGHLVLSTLHTNDAPSALLRLIDLGVEPYLVASTLNLVVSQRLVRKNCASCVSPVSSSEMKRPSLSTPKNSYTQVYKGTGCDACGATGYSGRTGVFALMECGSSIQEAVVRRASHAELHELARASGMQDLRSACQPLVASAVTSPEELLRLEYV
jgi:type IV pilus assembly protein PilB